MKYYVTQLGREIIDEAGAKRLARVEVAKLKKSGGTPAAIDQARTGQHSLAQTMRGDPRSSARVRAAGDPIGTVSDKSSREVRQAGKEKDSVRGQDTREIRRGSKGIKVGGRDSTGRSVTKFSIDHPVTRSAGGVGRWGPGGAVGERKPGSFSRAADKSRPQRNLDAMRAALRGR